MQPLPQAVLFFQVIIKINFVLCFMTNKALCTSVILSKKTWLEPHLKLHGDFTDQAAEVHRGEGPPVKLITELELSQIFLLKV